MQKVLLSAIRQAQDDSKRMQDDSKNVQDNNL